MARKAPRKSRAKSQGKSRILGFALPSAAKPFALALSAVAVVFAVGVGVSSMRDGGEREPAQAAAPAKPPAAVAKPVVTKPAVAAVPPTPPAPPPRDVPSVTEAAPGIAAAEPELSPTPPQRDQPAAQPPDTVVALLPPPVPPAHPPATPPAQPPAGNAALWRKNALPATVPPGKPVIAIVIDDMGLDRKRSTRMAALPGPLTLSWLPYAHDLPVQARAARANGHELMLHLPMEPSGSADPGPNALLVKLDKGEILRRTRTALDSFDGYVGVNNHMGSRFTADRAALAPVLGELHRRGLLWLDSRTTSNSAGIGLAQELRMPFAGRDIFLDNTAQVAAIRAQLGKVEQVAKRQGYGIAIGHPHDATIEALASWVPDVQKRGFVLVPVSAVVRAHHAGG